MSPRGGQRGKGRAAQHQRVLVHLEAACSKRQVSCSPAGQRSTCLQRRKQGLFADLLRHVEEAKTIDDLAAIININDLERDYFIMTHILHS